MLDQVAAQIGGFFEVLVDGENQSETRTVLFILFAIVAPGFDSHLPQLLCGNY